MSVLELKDLSCGKTGEQIFWDVDLVVNEGMLTSNSKFFFPDIRVLQGTSLLSKAGAVQARRHC